MADWFRCRLQTRERESFHLLLLDGRNRPKQHLCLLEGSWNHCPLDPKLVFSACLRHACPSVILVHNHPTGVPEPSREDIEMTSRFAEAGRVVGIEVLDHVIIGDGRYESLREMGYL